MSNLSEQSAPSAPSAPSRSADRNNLALVYKNTKIENDMEQPPQQPTAAKDPFDTLRQDVVSAPAVTRDARITLMCNRINEFTSSGVVTGTIARAAVTVLMAVLTANSNVPIPSIFTTPEGNIQAEWVSDTWATDVCFDSTTVSIEATNLTSFDPDDVVCCNVNDSQAISAWISKHI